MSRRLTMLFAGMDIVALLADEVRAMQQEQVGVRAHVPYMCMFFCCLLLEMSTIIDITLLCRSLHSGCMHCRNTKEKTLRQRESHFKAPHCPSVFCSVLCNFVLCSVLCSVRMLLLCSCSVLLLCSCAAAVFVSQHHASRIAAPCLSHHSICSMRISSMRSSMCSITMRITTRPKHSLIIIVPCNSANPLAARAWHQHRRAFLQGPSGCRAVCN